MKQVRTPDFFEEFVDDIFHVGGIKQSLSCFHPNIANLGISEVHLKNKRYIVIQNSIIYNNNNNNNNCRDSIPIPNVPVHMQLNLLP